jgi:N-acetylglucosaminyl-diphospho-decaprenol L-rhamnosyltransferase
LERFWAGRPFAPYRWTVVDNCSTDDSRDVARGLGAQVVEMGSNRGFSAANNAGVSATDAEVLIFCNPDVTVTAEGIEALANHVRRQGGVAAPQLVNADGSPQENGRGAPYPTRKVGHLLGRHDARYLRLVDVGETAEVVWVMGAAIAVRRADLDRLGGWDERFFLYYEDADLCLRAHAAGMPVRVDGNVRWVHGWGRATRRGMSLTAWRHELASAARFYRAHPYCLLPVGSSARRLRHVEAVGAGGVVV